MIRRQFDLNPIDDDGVANKDYTQAILSGHLLSFLEQLGPLFRDEDITYTVETHDRGAAHRPGLDGMTAKTGPKTLRTIIFKSEQDNDEATLIHEMLLHALPICERLIAERDAGAPYVQTTNEADHANIERWGDVVVAGVAVSRTRTGGGVYIRILGDMKEHLTLDQYNRVLGLPKVQEAFGGEGIAEAMAEARRPSPPREPDAHLGIEPAAPAVPEPEIDLDAVMAQFEAELADAEAEPQGGRKRGREIGEDEREGRE